MAQIVRMYLFIFCEECLAYYIPSVLALNFTGISGTTILYSGAIFLLCIPLAHHLNPALPSLRSEFKSNTKKEDKYLWGISYFMYIILIIIIANRYKKKQYAPTHFVIAGAMIRIMAHAIKLWAYIFNSFLATTICIQKGHKVIDKGPYAFVRHPFYTATILLLFSFPLIYGSIAGLWFSLLFIILLSIRIGYEEFTLTKELDGYKQYTQKVKCKLFPYIY